MIKDEIVRLSEPNLALTLTSSQHQARPAQRASATAPTAAEQAGGEASDRSREHGARPSRRR